MSMDIKRIKQMIGRCQSREELREVIKAANDRETELRKREQEQAAHAQEQAWLSAKKAKAGQVAVIFHGTEAAPIVVAPGKRRGDYKRTSFSTGTLLRVHCVQPRAKRAWFRNESSGEGYCMTPREIGMLGIRFFPDELTAHVALAQSGLLAAAA
jgi:hypothetical protein